MNDLFDKNWQRKLRDYIREEYQTRGIYPTSKEVQETFNHVVSILEATSASERDARLVGAGPDRKWRGKVVKGMKPVKDERKISTLRAERQGLLTPGEIKDPTNQSSDEFKKFIGAHKTRKERHQAARGVQTKISPSSPARPQGEVEKDTRFLMGQGFSPSHLRRIMSDTGR